MSVPGDVPTTLLPHLTPLTRYEVSVSAQYASGTSLPVRGYGSTTEGMVFSIYQNIYLKLVVQRVASVCRTRLRAEPKSNRGKRAELQSLMATGSRRRPSLQTDLPASR